MSSQHKNQLKNHLLSTKRWHPVLGSVIIFILLLGLVTNFNIKTILADETTPISANLSETTNDLPDTGASEAATTESESPSSTIIPDDSTTATANVDANATNETMAAIDTNTDEVPIDTTQETTDAATEITSTSTTVPEDTNATAVNTEAALSADTDASTGVENSGENLLAPETDSVSTDTAENAADQQSDENASATTSTTTADLITPVNEEANGDTNSNTAVDNNGTTENPDTNATIIDDDANQISTDAQPTVEPEPQKEVKPLKPETVPPQESKKSLKISKDFAFSLSESPITSKKSLSWHSAQFRPIGENTNEVTENSVIDINVLAQTDKNALEINGTCQKAYYVVLIYSQSNDYDQNPSKFVYNKAFSCQNGSYQHQLKDLPDNLPDGTYYLLVAEQGEIGPWQPITAIQPVKIRTEYRYN